jgi:hypothetical protein
MRGHGSRCGTGGTDHEAPWSSALIIAVVNSIDSNLNVKFKSISSQLLFAWKQDQIPELIFDMLLLLWDRRGQ